MIRTIPEILAAKGMSQGELVRRSGLSRMTIWCAFHGKATRSLDTKIKIARALDVPLADLWPDDAKAIEAVA